jgi:hypothetical protein
LHISLATLFSNTLENNRDKKNDIDFTVEDGLFEKMNEDDMELR